MSNSANVIKLYESQGKELQLEWAAGKNSGNNTFVKDKNNPKAGIVGYFNLIHSSQVQILGKTEMNYLRSLPNDSMDTALQKLFGEETRMAVIVDQCRPTEKMNAIADKNNVALFISPLPGERLVDTLRYYFAQLLADKINMHGVFMEVISIGVLLIGPSAIGKSELALELITRGHRLIADDAPLFARIAPDIIIGTSPPVIQDFLEVRGLGVLNLRQMYGDSAIKMSKYLKLIVALKDVNDYTEANENRLINPATTQDVLGMNVAVSTIQVAPGRNLAVLVEAAVRNHLLRLHNYYADADIIARQKNLMQEV